LCLIRVLVDGQALRFATDSVFASGI
jgi:hypothetical protein